MHDLLVAVRPFSTVWSICVDFANQAAEASPVEGNAHGSYLTMRLVPNHAPRAMLRTHLGLEKVSFSA